jgi:NAD(P)-dependent dehydrogenase (short-subunit alcohol dehydrogenase family)
MDLKDKIAVVSGGSSGIGRAAAIKLASQGAEVYVIGRDAAKGAEVEAALKVASGGKGAFVRGDFSLIKDVRRVVMDLQARLPKLDALILSVGSLDFEAQKTAEGLDKNLTVNFFHKVILVEGLKPLLAKTQGRVVLVAADLPDSMVPDWANFEGAQAYAGPLALPRMHSACLSMLQTWAAAWASEGIELSAIHPGVVKTGFFREAKGPWKILSGLFNLLASSPEIPAELLSWLAFAPEAKGSNGYLYPKPKDHSKRRLLARDAQTLERVQKVAREALARVPA